MRIWLLESLLHIISFQSQDVSKLFSPRLGLLPLTDLGCNSVRVRLFGFSCQSALLVLNTVARPNVFEDKGI